MHKMYDFTITCMNNMYELRINNKTKTEKPNSICVFIKIMICEGNLDLVRFFYF